jgi:3-oxoacyl-[acyl-carrier-protein] synthase-3
MGARIEAVATATHRGHLLGRGALHLTDEAARECLRRSGRRADELELLINVGIYKDHNAAEPALAAIIQEDIGANPGHPPRLGHHGTFSFDLVNGGCGVVTAAHLLAGFVAPGGASKLGMIVAGDADPSPRTSRGFPFTAAGGAMLLARGEGGFEHFLIRTFPEYANQFEAALRWDPHAGLMHRGRNVVEIVEAPAFAGSCVACADEIARELLADRVSIAEVDLLVTSQYPPGFGVQLARRLGISTDRVPEVATDLGAAHTAGPIAALDAARSSGQLAAARHILFVTVGAGITVAAALYRN